VIVLTFVSFVSRLQLAKRMAKREEAEEGKKEAEAAGQWGRRALR
jgi:hypothetical protein